MSKGWLAAPGDDPRWAQADFNDSGWKALNPDKPLSQQGFRGARSIWYRAHVQLRPEAPPAAIYVEHLTFNYSLYANGQLIGTQGEANPSKATVDPFPNGFAIPPQLTSGGQNQLVIAIHVTGSPLGFLDLPPLERTTRLELVSPALVRAIQSSRLMHDWIEGFTVLGLNLVVAFCGLAIWWSLRDQLEYLALTVWVFANVLTLLTEFMAHLRTASPFSRWALLLVFMEAVSSVGELEFMRLILKRRQTALWLGLELLVVLINLTDPLVGAGLLPLSFGLGEVFLRPLVTEVLVFVLLLRAARRGNEDASVLLLPVVLWSAAEIYKFVRITVWFAFKVFLPNLTGSPLLHLFSYSVSFGTLADLLGLLALMMIILKRTVRLSRERADLAAEVAAAEELQLLLMARASRPTPGYSVQTEYHPAGQVGGDFFLVQPCDEDSSLVAIVGDVSGKGLQAAMRVSMILGVLRREVMNQPDRVLQTLNTALADQSDFGFTTACCVRLESDGSFRFANAGHLDPYVNGEELTSEGALPLGIDPEACYPVYEGHLRPGESIILISDGVLEARSKKGEIFGFERTRKLVQSNAAAIATAAQQFGQEDDITVLAVALA